MKKITLALLLFASCQVQENKHTPQTVAKIPEEPATEKQPINSAKIILPQPQQPTVDENADLSETTDKKSITVKSASSTSNVIENPVSVNEMIEATTIKTDSSLISGGGGNYEDGYIPFIKQYW